MVLFALAMIVILGMVAVALDGGYGFVQNRRAQNATDFAAYAGAKELFGSTLCNGAAVAPSTAKMANIVQDIVSANSSTVGSAWLGTFLDNVGTKMTGAGSTFSSTSNAGYPPPGACGLTVGTTSAFTWPSYLAGIIGQPTLSGNASASVGSQATGNSISIASLNKVGPHAILGGGSGKFVVSGDIYLNTTVPSQPWTGLRNGWYYDDAIDAKVGSSLYIYGDSVTGAGGTVHTVGSTWNNGSGGGTAGLWPLDTCFGNNAEPIRNAAGAVAYAAGVPPPYPQNHPICSVGAVALYYNHIDPTLIVPSGGVAVNDPLQSSGAPQNPANSATAINCPGQALLTDPAMPAAGGTMKPGEYTTPVKITTSMTFGDCSALGGGEAAYPGIYRFDQGLWISPQQATGVVTGTNVVLSTKKGYPLAGNVPCTTSCTAGAFVASGIGNGAPCLPNPTQGQNGAVVDGSAGSICGGSSPTTYGAIMQSGGGIYGTGDNFSVMIGGVAGSQVNLTGPTTGTYAGAGVAPTPGVVLYQDFGTQANYGFDVRSGDAAAINVTGVVYNASLPNYGGSASFYYWDPGNGIMAYAGGTLQTGYGAGWSTGPAQSTGSVTITGTTVVDDFNTDGATTITIIGKPYKIPGGGILSLIG